MFSKTVLVIVFLMSTISWASSPLVGKWKYVEMRCKSGAKPNFGSTTTTMLDADGEFSASTIKFEMRVKFKLDPTESAKIKKQVEDAKAVVVALPDGPSKTEALNKINEAFAQIQKIENETSCSTKFEMNYTIEGQNLKTEMTSESSDCSGWTPSKDRNDVVEFSLKDNNLELLSSKKSESKDQTCPVGDSSITVLTRN